jgi:hypothetical protein
MRKIEGESEGQSQGDGGGKDDEDVEDEGDGDGGDPVHPRRKTLTREEGKRVRGEEKKDV